MPVNNSTIMELIYSMKRKPLKYEPPHFESLSDPEVIRPICTISTSNIIAFSSHTELLDTEGDSWGGHVYVCDLDTPWESHKVTSTVYPISALEWDTEGKLLLIATTIGEVSIYVQKEYLLNEWTCQYTACFAGEHVIKSAFFHNGQCLVTIDKKPEALIVEKLQPLRSSPTLKGFGGIYCEGACIITSTGLIGVLTPPTSDFSNSLDIPQALTATECLTPNRNHVTAASIAHKNGKLMVATVCGSGCVRCYVCGVMVCGGGPPTVTVQPLPTIFVPNITSISWCLREDTESLLIAGQTLTLWKLTDCSYPVHKLLYKGPAPGSTTPSGTPKPLSDSFNTVTWQQTAMWPRNSNDIIEGRELVVCPRLPFIVPLVLLVSSKSLTVYSRDKHHFICCVSLVTNGNSSCDDIMTPPTSSSPKKMKFNGSTDDSVNAVVCHADMSWLGGVAVVVDSHAQLHVYKMPQIVSDIPSSPSLQQVMTILEYSMVSGFDCLDILMTLKPSVAESLYERLTENFQRQPASFQQYYYNAWLRLRISLCSVVARAVTSVSWLRCVQILRGTAAACAAALREDKTDAPLSALLDDIPPSELDKMLVALEAKCDVSPEASGLQAIRRPLQRVIDIALTLLATLNPHSTGYELWSDANALSLLRRLVVVVRASGRGGDALSRPLARLAAATTLKSDLLEECATVSGHMATPKIWESLPRCSVSAPHQKSWPFYFDYGVQPEALKFIPEMPGYIQNDSAPPVPIDSIRYMYLGGGGRASCWRQCGRCGAIALPVAQPARHPLQQAHDARMVHSCRCGGKWTLIYNI